jgi:GNAT superfamily N-acetyltransferase
VRVVHDLRAGQDFGENEIAGKAIAELSKDTLLGISVWDVISKKNRMRVTGCVRLDDEGHCEALGFVVHRLNQHTLQILYLGVAPAHRRGGFGRMLVRAVRDIARRELMCLSIIVLLEPSMPDVAASPTSTASSNAETPLAGIMAFWRATGFKRSDVKGL